MKFAKMGTLTRVGIPIRARAELKAVPNEDAEVALSTLTTAVGVTELIANETFTPLLPLF